MTESSSPDLRSLPSVNDLVDHDLLASWRAELTRSVVVDAAKSVLQQERDRLLAGGSAGDVPGLEALAHAADVYLMQSSISTLEPVINATGIVVHTGLGRAPVAEVAADAMAESARNYVPVELDMQDGTRGRREDHVRTLLCSLTGSESATVVNNTAAALHLTLSALAHGQEVIVSRGELVEIGGSFRLPELMEASGAILREVGTTNKTRLGDYVGAISESTAMILKIHPSNYRIEGFSDGATIAGLAPLAREAGVPLVHDIGSGLLRPATLLTFQDEPDATTSLQDGADLVLFSGDKLLGGPQAGVIVGREDLVTTLSRYPLMRALRLDKVLLSGLRETLRLHQQESLAIQDVPIWSMLAVSPDQLRARAEAIVAGLASSGVKGRIEVVDAPGFVGGGAMPMRGFRSVAIRVLPSELSSEEFHSRLRSAAGRRVLGRIHEGALWLDLRTVFSEHDAMLQAALVAALS